MCSRRVKIRTVDSKRKRNLEKNVERITGSFKCRSNVLVNILRGVFNTVINHF